MNMREVIVAQPRQQPRVIACHVTHVDVNKLSLQLHQHGVKHPVLLHVQMTTLSSRSFLTGFSLQLW